MVELLGNADKTANKAIKPLGKGDTNKIWTSQNFEKIRFKNRKCKKKTSQWKIHI